MDISALALCQATVPTGTQADAAVPETGFADALAESIQTGAPPGPEPPSTGVKVEEEVAILGPNAQTRMPDFLSISSKDEANAGSDEVTGDPSKEGSDSVETILMYSAALPATAFATPVAPVAAPTATHPIKIPANASADLAPEVVPSSAAPAKPARGPATNIDRATAAQYPRYVETKEPQPCVVNFDDGAKPQILDADVAPIAQPTDAKSRNLLDDQAFADLAPDVKATPPVITPPATIVPEEASQAVDGEKPKTDAEVAAQPGTAAPASNTDKAVKKPHRGQPKVDAVAPSSDEIETEKTVEVETVTAKADVVQTDRRNPESAKLEISGDKEVQRADQAKPLPRRELELVVRQITDRMELLAATRPKNGVTVQLEPAHLGSVTMTVKSLGGMVEAQISASDDRVRTALEQNSQQLVQAMDHRGYKLETVTIAPQQQAQNTHRDASPQQQQQQQHQHQQQSNYRQESHGSRSFVAPARTATRAATGVDYWI